MARSKRRRRWGWRLALMAALALGAAWAIFWITLPNVEALRHGNPPATAMMKAHEKAGRARRVQLPVALAHISRHLRDAVVDSEDARFWEHAGMDRVETEEAVRKALERHKLGRGASTITQQL